MKLVLTQICDGCDVERHTELCSICNGTYCKDCMPDHKRRHAFYDEDDEVCEQINNIITQGGI